MPELSVTEKRRILRERRAKKLAANSSNRLNKITGMNGSQELHKEEPAEDQNIPTAAPAGTTAPTASKVSASPSPVPDPLHEDPDDQMDMQAVLQNLLKGGKDHLHQHDSQGPAQPSLLPDDFMQTMSSMMSQGGEGTPGMPDLGLPQEPAASEIDVYRVNQLRSVFTVARYIAVLLLLITQIWGVDNYQTSFENLRPEMPGTKHGWTSVRWNFWSQADRIILRDASSCRFWNMFVVLELAVSALYLFVRSKLPRTPLGMPLSLVSSVIPARYKPVFSTVLSYTELLKFFMGDLALVLMVLGVWAYVFRTI